MPGRIVRGASLTQGDRHRCGPARPVLPETSCTAGREFQKAFSGSARRGRRLRPRHCVAVTIAAGSSKTASIEYRVVEYVSNNIALVVARFAAAGVFLGTGPRLARKAFGGGRVDAIKGQSFAETGTLACTFATPDSWKIEAQAWGRTS